jgi:tetratricopeptide (TPR) repeat protein
MNTTEITTLLNKPLAINELQTASLEKVVQEFPYFQGARAVCLKALYNQSSFKYNYALKTTAAHTADRSILFDFISSLNFKTTNTEDYAKNDVEILDIIVENSVVVPPYKIEKSIIDSINASNLKTQTEIIAIENEKLVVGKPLEFSISEKHSFQEWLQISKSKPIYREISSFNDVKASEMNPQKQKKIALIDKFIETNPKIPQIKHNALPPSFIHEPSKSDNSYLMTETLAKVYLEQKKYIKAIQAYDILILKYPEKSSFFADRIQEIKLIQQNNT